MNLARALAAAPDLSPFQVGIVTSTPTAGTIGVRLGGATTILPVLTGTAYAVGDAVLVLKSGRSAGVVVGKYGTPAVVAPPPTGVEPPAAGTTLRTAVLLPIYVLTHHVPDGTSGSWKAKAKQGRSGGAWHRAVAYYGNQLTALGADLGQTFSASIAYRRLAGIGPSAATAPRFHALVYKTRPPGGPGFITGPLGEAGQALKHGKTGAYQLPTAFTQDLLQGFAGSIGVGAAVATMAANPGLYPWTRWADPQEWASAFALTVTYYG